MKQPKTNPFGKFTIQNKKGTTHKVCCKSSRLDILKAMICFFPILIWMGIEACIEKLKGQLT